MTPPRPSTVSTVLAVASDAPQVARRHVQHVLTGHGLDLDLIADAELLVCDAVTYLGRGQGHHLDLTVEVGGGVVTVTVTGRRSADLPSMPGTPLDPEGFGLGALDRLASAWGIRRQNRTTRVWFVLTGPTTGESPAGPRPVVTPLPAGDAVRSELLLRITEALATADTLQAITNAITTLVRSHLSVEFAGIAVRDPMAPGRVRYVSMDPLPAETALAWNEIPIDEATAVGTAISSSRATFHASVRSADEQFPGIGAHMRDAGVQAVAHLPLVVHGRAIGVLAVSWADEHEVDADEQALLLTVAGYAAQAVGRAIGADAAADSDRVAQLAAAAAAAAAEPGRTSGTSEAHQRPLRVMLVDDTADVRLLLAALFARRPDLRVVAEADNGEEAIVLAAALQPDLIVLDVAMPVLDGISALPQLQSAAPDARIVILSALSPDRQAPAALAAGAAAYVQKTAAVGTLVEDLLDGARLLDVALRELTPHADLTLDADPRQVGLARRFVGDVLEHWDHAELADTVTLLLSELVTNAIVHADTAPDVSVRLLPDHVHVEVTDTSPSDVAPRPLTDDQPSGRGFALIDALAERWGTAPLPVGKVVWFDVARRRT